MLRGSEAWGLQTDYMLSPARDAGTQFPSQGHSPFHNADSIESVSDMRKLTAQPVTTRSEIRLHVFLPALCLLGIPALLSAMPTIGTPTVVPGFVAVGQATPVTATCQLTTAAGDPALLSGGMNLVRLSSSGSDVAVLGVMTAGSGGAYSYTFTDTETTTGQFQLQCTAAFSSAVQRVRSARVTVPVVLPVSLSSLTTAPATPLASQQFSLTVAGANFDPASAAIVINGPGCSPCTVPNNLLTAKSASSVTGPVTLGNGAFTVAVRNTGTGAISGTLPLTVGSVPTLTSISTAPATPLASQQFALTVAGTNFDPATASIVITGPGCTPCSVANSALTAKSATSVTGPVTVGSGAFTVAVQNGSTSAISGTLPLTVGVVPTLTSLSTTPATPLASQQFALTIVGTNFDPATASIVITGPGCTPCSVANGALTAKSATSVTGPVTVGSGAFTVAVQNGSTSAISGTLPLTVAVVPTLTSLSTTPATPLASQQFTLTIVGTNFDPATASIVITGPGCTPCSVANGALTAKSATSVTGPVTVGSGAFTVAVQNGSTSAISGTLPLTVAVVPTLTSLSTAPATPQAGQQFALTMAGSNFDPASAQINITGPNCTPCTVANSALTAKSATSISGPATLGAGSFTIAVVNTATGATSGTLPLTLGGTGPTITSMTTTPTSPVAASSFTFLITGTNFNPTTAQVLISGPGCAPCTILNGSLSGASATQVAGGTTLSSSGSFTVAVQNGPSGATSGTVALTMAAPPAPTITSFAPVSATIGTTVTVTGTNLVAGATAASISLAAQAGGTLTAPLASATATSLTFVIPAGAATGTVTAALVGQTATSSGRLTINPSSTFTLTTTPASATLIKGQTVSYSVQMASANGFSQLAPLSVTGLPSGVTASFKPAMISAGQTSILTLTAPATQAVATSTITVSAAATVDGLPVSQTNTASLAVTAPTTSFLGRTVVADPAETPLVGVAVSMVGQDGSGNATGCTGRTTSDSAGNFALTNLAANCVGPQLVAFDGNTVTSPVGNYAGLQLVFTLVSGSVVVSPVLVHLPIINSAETFNVIQNDTVDQSYTFKTIPGLKITVYAGTTFTKQDGTKPDPFPLAAVEVPVDRLPDVMPTTTAGVGAFIVAFQPAESNASQAVAVWYPNTLNTPPGTNIPLMTLDPTKGRMVPYGTGTISTDGTTIIPDVDPSTGSKQQRYGIVHFDWHGPLAGPPNQNDPTPDPNGPCTCHPVDLASGIEVLTSTDIGFSGNRGSISVTRTYRTLAVPGAIPGPFGWGTSHNFEYRLDTLTPQSASVINLILPTGARIPFTLQADGTLINTTVPMVAGWVMTTSANGTTTVRQKGGSYLQFTPGYVLTGSVLVAIGDPNGNVTTLVRPSGAPYQISEIDDPVGRKLTLQYNGYNVTRITDPIGRTVSYTYNSAGYLATFTDVLGGVTSYQYDSQGRVTQITDAHGAVTKNSYDANGRVSSQVLPNGGSMTYAYTLVNALVPTSPVTQTVVTDPLGNVTTYRFNTNGFVVGITDAVGQSRIFTRQQGTNQILSITGTGTCPSCGKTQSGDVKYTYDAFGNVLTQTDALGNTATFTYDPVYNKVTSVKDPLGNAITSAYDARGNLIKLSDGRGSSTEFVRDGSGLITTIKDPTGNSAVLVYDTIGNLVVLTNALGKTNKFSYDGVSRLVAELDPLGRASQISYNPQGQISSFVDGNGSSVSFAYGTDGFRLSATDARSAQTSFAYDSAGRLTSVTDARGRVRTYKYDGNNNLIGLTNRRGQKSSFSYDGLNRLISETYTDSTVVRRYDLSGRLTSVDDSLSGTFSRLYDLAGRLVKTIGPTGAVTYGLDADGRVVSRQVQGGVVASYTYDANSNMTKAIMGDASVSRTYDARNLPAATLRSNGVAGEYTFDPAGRVLGITETVSGNSIFARALTYDAGGQLVSASVNDGLSLRTRAADAAVDGANQLVKFGGTTYSNDADGNRLSETDSSGAVTSYAWDARGRLQSVSEPNGTTTSFTYDYAGNMIQRQESFNGSNISQTFVIDDVSNLVGIQQSGSPAVSILDGRDPDDIIAFTKGGNTYFPLSDQISSVGALTDGIGTIVGRGYYDVFGQAEISGEIGPFQYAGRPVASSKIYYYRARFYDSATGRFLSEDPLGLIGGGSNFYAYSGNSPILTADRSGQIWWIIGGAVIGGGLDLGYQLWQNGWNLRCVDWTQVGLATAGGALAGAGLGWIGRAVPATLYHFTTAEAAGAIAEGGINAGSGFQLFGPGVYASSINSPLAAQVMGAASVESSVAFSTQGLNVVPTLWPGAFRVIGNVPVSSLLP